VNSRFDEFGVHVRYGTIDDYMSLVNVDGAPWPEYAGDFFPLGTNSNIYTSQIDWSPMPPPSEYWTGHYSTRPLMKGLVARANGAKHSSEIATSIACATMVGGHSLAIPSPNPNRNLSTHTYHGMMYR